MGLAAMLAWCWFWPFGAATLVRIFALAAIVLGAGAIFGAAMSLLNRAEFKRILGALRRR